MCWSSIKRVCLLYGIRAVCINFRSFSVQAIVLEDIEPQHLEAKGKTDAILEHFLQLTCLSCGDVTVIKHCDKNHP